MNAKWLIGGVIGGVIIFIFVLISASNSMVRNEQVVGAKWGDVETSYQRRVDLIPNLVKTVKGAAQFEEKVFTEITEARAKISTIKIEAADLDNPEKMKAFAQAQDGLKSSMSRLLAVAENYPNLKATEAYRDFMTQLEGTENRIQKARHDYNDAVAAYNTSIHVFPGSMGAGGRTDRKPFQADVGSEKAPSIDFK